MFFFSGPHRASAQASPSMTYVSLAPGMNEVITANPANLEYILKDNFANYPKGPEFLVR